MSKKTQSLLAIFSYLESAESCVNVLLGGGIEAEEVSILLSDDPAVVRNMLVGQNTKTPESATTGAATGGIIGGTLGILAGIGALSIPGLGPFIAAGPIMGMLAGMGAGAAAGGALGILVGLGLPEIEARAFIARLREGDVLLTITTDNTDKLIYAHQVLEDEGAAEITLAANVNATNSENGLGAGARTQEASW